MKKLFANTFSSFKVRNFKVYYIGQLISVSGTFLQALAQDWLVLKLTNSGVMLGIALAFQFLPMLLLGSYGGVIADRFSKLKILYITQTISGILALSLGILVLTGNIQIWMVFGFALCLGLINSADNPARQSFVYEMVGKEQIKNATGLWVSLISFARIIGPAIGGVLIATIGIGECFIINAVSYIAVVIALFMINTKELHINPVVKSAKGQIREGLKYVKSMPVLFITLIMMAIIGTITYEWQASMPLFAKFVLHGDAGYYAIITVAMGVGMLIGGLFSASSSKSSLKRIIFSAFLFGVCVIIASLATSLTYAIFAFGLVGMFSILFANLNNSILQLNTDPNMRGRVMALWGMAFFGSTAIGGPLIGIIGQYAGARWALAVGGIAAIFAAILGMILLMKNKDLNIDEPKKSE